jgi:hypothetical protein
MVEESVPQVCEVLSASQFQGARWGVCAYLFLTIDILSACILIITQGTGSLSS